MKRLPGEQTKDLYRYFLIHKETKVYEATERFLREFADGKMVMGDYENMLGVTFTCMDMDLYKSGDCFFIVMNLINLDDESSELVNEELIEINFKIFSEAIRKNGYVCYRSVGTGAFYDYIFKPLVIKFDPNRQLNKDTGVRNKEIIMDELRFKSTVEFANWARDQEIYTIEYLSILDGRKSQNCFEVDIEKKDTQLVCIEKNAHELFFSNKDEMDRWTEFNEATDVVNDGLSDVFVGFNVFQCKTGEVEMTLYIDATALLP
ncbi:ubiquitin family protein [Acetobacterium woodii]|uniref:Uncharacterized protein n=1 Tax=Acetobacterium woodii (strain ATCC 29683 / DSM 1030 / JCM 2381 / KCTC 1655 / WB1) TaxID=931626 RepID=H6LDD6_ACEWD|nr:hypothetical protein [Acetobacterium woodii]AFA47908.1 hypothetical protein Awo_c11240 [Acetobacterium woodii DSM 1030]